MKLSATGCGVIAIALASLATLGPRSAEDVATLGGPDFDRSVASLAALLLVAISAWILTCVTLSLLASQVRIANHLFGAITPRFLRRALFLGAAGALAVGPVAASDSTTHGADGRHSGTAISKVLDGLQLPDRPIGTTHVGRHALTYTVRTGDSLWAIAARRLEPGATPSAIAAEARRWHDANRSVIGRDPNLIFPGQLLTPPTKDSR